MAPSSSLFELLPDEVVISILETVGTCRKDADKKVPEMRVKAAEDLVRAQLVCKRFQKLAHQVKSLDWPLRNENEGLGLAAFVHHPCFSVNRINLLITAEFHDEVAHHLIFSSPLLKRVPAKVSIFFLDRTRYSDSEEEEERPVRVYGSCHYSLSHPGPSRNIMESLLGSRMKELSVSALPYGSISIRMLREAPNTSLTRIDLSKAIIAVEALEHLLQRCKRLETLKVVAEEYDDPAESGKSIEDTKFNIKSERLTSLDLQGTYSGFMYLDLHAPRLLELVICCNLLKLTSPSLRSLSLTIRESQHPVSFIQPCTRLEHLSIAEIREKYWTEIVAPILLQSRSIKSLTLKSADDTAEVLPIGRFLAQLPPSIRKLSVDGGILVGLRLTEPEHGRHKLSELRHLEIDSAFKLEAYLQIRSLCEAMPNLQKLKLSVYEIEESDQPGTLALFRKDFKKIPEANIHLLY